MGESSWIARRPAESLDRGGAGRWDGSDSGEDHSTAIRKQRNNCLMRVR